MLSRPDAPYEMVRLRWWDPLLALAIVAGVSILAMVLFTP